jgi:hypothetical protein
LHESNHRSLGAVLVKLTTLAEKTRVVAVRERARELPPTWKETLSKQRALLATGRARWVDIDPDDCARVLALAALLQAARSGEVTDARGVQMSEQEVGKWVSAKLDVASWPISGALNAAAEEPSTTPTASPDNRVMSQPASPKVTSAARVASALPTLRRLRVASFERLVREALRVDPSSTRASVLAELETAGPSVRWFGRSVVFLRLPE